MALPASIVVCVPAMKSISYALRCVQAIEPVTGDNCGIAPGFLKALEGAGLLEAFYSYTEGCDAYVLTEGGHRVLDEWGGPFPYWKGQGRERGE